MKKKIIVCIFALLILATALIFIKGAVDSYRYDINPANGVDIFEGLGAVLTVIVGTFVIFYELDLFYLVYYFLIKPKTMAKSILNILSNFVLLLIFAGNHIARLFAITEEVIVPISLFFLYVIFRIVYIVLAFFLPDPKRESTFLKVLFFFLLTKSLFGGTIWMLYGNLIFSKSGRTHYESDRCFDYDASRYRRFVRDAKGKRYGLPLLSACHLGYNSVYRGKRQDNFRRLRRHRRGNFYVLVRLDCPCNLEFH
jgi:hypothetical protein